MRENRIQDIVIKRKKRSFEVSFNIIGEWKKYYCENIQFFCEYDFDIENIPDGVLIVPFLCEILPIAWLCDAEIELDQLDKDFFESIKDIRTGYQKMYPMLKFKGDVQVKDLFEKKANTVSNQVATMFSGGLDAFTTLIRHIEERPILLSVWGSDIMLDDAEGWKIVEQHVVNTSNQFGLDYSIIKSNFRQIINQTKLSKLVLCSGDEWWHGFQHGIGLLGFCAAISYHYNIKTVYIASSFTADMTYTCASDPTIDNYVKYCGCNVFHDSYELSRQEKAQRLCDYVRKTNQIIHIRVCWESRGGENCCHCEKCYRTIMEIVTEGGNPNSFGFNWNKGQIHKMKKNLLYRIIINPRTLNSAWANIKKRLHENKDNIIDYNEYLWLDLIQLERLNKGFTKRALRQCFKVKGKAMGILRKIKQGIRS